MLESIVMTLVARSTASAADILVKAFKEYLKRKGERVSESPTEEEIVKSLASLEARESSATAVADAKNVFETATVQLSAYRAERERQARNSYNLAWCVLVGGSMFVLTGIGWMIFGSSVTPGMVTSAVGGIASLCSSAIFKFSNDANDRLDGIALSLHKIESTQMALDVVQKISDETERNNAIKQIVLNLSQMPMPTERKSRKRD